MKGVKEGYELDREYLQDYNSESIETLKERGVAFHEIDRAALRDAYQDIVKKEGFTFDPVWQAAVDKAIAENPE